MEIGFAQLGRRLLAQEKRELARTLDLSFVCINDRSAFFRMAALARVFEYARVLGPRAEVLFIDLDSEESRVADLLADFPALRVLIPAKRIPLADAVSLGMREALAPYVCVLRSAYILADLDVDSMLAGFRADPRLFALGPCFVNEEGSDLPYQDIRLRAGRLELCGQALASAPALREQHDAAQHEARNMAFLPNYVGVYAREKALFIPPPEKRLLPEWACLEWFYGAWARGWRSSIEDPRFCCMSEVGASPDSFSCRTLSARMRFYRHEIFFLRRHDLRREGFFRSLRRSGLAFLFAWLTPKLRVPSARGEVLCAEEVFAMIQGGEPEAARSAEDAPRVAGEDGEQEAAVPYAPSGAGTRIAEEDVAPRNQNDGQEGQA